MTEDETEAKMALMARLEHAVFIALDEACGREVGAKVDVALVLGALGHVAVQVINRSGLPFDDARALITDIFDIAERVYGGRQH